MDRRGERLWGSGFSIEWPFGTCQSPLRPPAEPMQRRANRLAEAPLCVDVFATELGWLALAGADATVAQVTYPRATKAAALAALDPEIRSRASPAHGIRNWRVGCATLRLAQKITSATWR